MRAIFGGAKFAILQKCEFAIFRTFGILQNHVAGVFLRIRFLVDAGGPLTTVLRCGRPCTCTPRPGLTLPVVNWGLVLVDHSPGFRLRGFRIFE